MNRFEDVFERKHGIKPVNEVAKAACSKLAKKFERSHKGALPGRPSLRKRSSVSRITTSITERVMLVHVILKRPIDDRSGLTSLTFLSLTVLARFPETLAPNDNSRRSRKENKKKEKLRKQNRTRSVPTILARVLPPLPG